MSNKLNILESKKLFKEFNYLMSDFEFKNEFIREYGEGFELEMKNMLDEEPIIKQACIDKFGDALKNTLSDTPSDTPSNTPSDSTEVILFTGVKIVETIIKLENDESKVKDLYRKIVQKTHPDKVNSDALNQLYIRATEAHKRNDLLSMYSICNELGIEFEISREEVEFLRNHIGTVKNQQINFENSHLWRWFHEKNEFIKKEMIKHFLLHHAPSVKSLF